MSDIADDAEKYIEAAKQAGIEQARRAPMLKPKGTCWFCEEPVPVDLRFCNRDCCDDFEHEEEALKRAGR